MGQPLFKIVSEKSNVHLLRVIMRHIIAEMLNVKMNKIKCLITLTKTTISELNYGQLFLLSFTI